MDKRDFEILEGIRGLAAFVVLLNHARGYLFAGGRAFLAQPDADFWDKWLIGAFQVTSLGLAAVIVFFVLSGFSIAHSIAVGDSTVRFYVRRVIRLMPPAIGGLVLAWLALAVHDGDQSLRAAIPQYWSLYQEAIFYAAAPLLVTAAWRWRFALVASVGYVLGLAAGEGGILHNFVFQYAFYFAVGVLAYHRRQTLHRLALSRRWLLAVSVLAITAMAATAQIMSRVSLLIACAFSLVLICNFLRHRVTNTALRLLGAMSYTLYVTHYAAIILWSLVLQHLGLQDARASLNPWLWMTAVPFALVASFAMYLLVERPALQVLERMRRTSGSSPVVSSRRT